MAQSQSHAGASAARVDLTAKILIEQMQAFIADPSCIKDPKLRWQIKDRARHLANAMEKPVNAKASSSDPKNALIMPTTKNTLARITAEAPEVAAIYAGLVTNLLPALLTQRYALPPADIAYTIGQDEIFTGDMLNDLEAYGLLTRSGDYFLANDNTRLLVEPGVADGVEQCMDKIQDILAAISRAKARKYTEQYGSGQYAEREGGLDTDMEY